MAKQLRQLKSDAPRKKSNPLLEIVSAIAQFSLLIIGIISVAIAFFKEDGLLGTLGGKVLRMEFVTLLILIPLVIVTVYLGRYWFDRNFSKSSSALTAELAMYTVMAIGAYHLLKYFIPALQ